jgi:hypothetical protein
MSISGPVTMHVCPLLYRVYDVHRQATVWFFFTLLPSWPVIYYTSTIRCNYYGPKTEMHISIMLRRKL